MYIHVQYIMSWYIMSNDIMQVQSIPVSSDVPAYNTTYKHIKDNSSTYMYIHVYTYICTCTSVCCIVIGS